MIFIVCTYLIVFSLLQMSLYVNKGMLKCTGMQRLVINITVSVNQKTEGDISVTKCGGGMSQ